MSCIIPGSIATPRDLEQLAVKPGAVYTSGPLKGRPVPAEVQQSNYVAQLIAANPRSKKKWITATFTATGNAEAVLGNSYGLSADADANGGWVFQNPVGKTAFNAAVNGSPFRYLGVQLSVSASSMFDACTFTELINDYDNNTTRSYKPTVNAGLNTFSQIATTRYLNVAGEFNGFYGLKVTGITNGQTLTWQFNVVDIDRGW
jgi:hypothetical protein